VLPLAPTDVVYIAAVLLRNPSFPLYDIILLSKEKNIMP
jgi:hypothetical protein